MTSTLTRMPQRRGSNSSSISAADLLRLLSAENSKSGFLRQREISKIIKIVKWRHRFVVLAQNALYVYENEMSRSPTTSIPLLGYTAVKREKSPTCAWVFALIPGVSSLRPKIFACSNEADRKEWMYRIKSNLYSANNVKQTTRPPKYRETQDLSPEDEEYLELELPVMSPDDITSGGRAGAETIKDAGSDSDENKSGNNDETVRVGTSFTKTSLPPPLTQDDRECDSPPRYSAIVQGEEYHYQNQVTMPKAKKLGMEKACRITDETISRDRNKCVEMLKATKKVGTYLIRKSRTGDYFVLSILATEDTVKEYRIEEEYGMYHFVNETNHEFPTLDALLSYYTTYEKVPVLERFLGWGIYECVESVQTYEQVGELPEELPDHENEHLTPSDKCNNNSHAFEAVGDVADEGNEYMVPSNKSNNNAQAYGLADGLYHQERKYPTPSYTINNNAQVYESADELWHQEREYLTPSDSCNNNVQVHDSVDELCDQENTYYNSPSDNK